MGIKCSWCFSIFSDPHPFISILCLDKGKRLLPRVIRLLPEAKVTILLVLFTVCFHQIDVVRDAQILDQMEAQGSIQWTEISRKTEVMLHVLPHITGLIVASQLRLLTGLLNMLLGTGTYAVLAVVKCQVRWVYTDRSQLELISAVSQPGIALLTAFMSRVDQLKHEPESANLDDWQNWYAVDSHEPRSLNLLRSYHL